MKRVATTMLLAAVLAGCGGATVRSPAQEIRANFAAMNAAALAGNGKAALNYMTPSAKTLTETMLGADAFARLWQEEKPTLDSVTVTGDVARMTIHYADGTRVDQTWVKTADGWRASPN
jgi:hypothetical protein